LPQLFWTVAIAPLVSVILPLLAAGEPERHRRDTSELLSVVLGASLAFSALLAATAQLWIDWLLPGFSASDRVLAVYLARVQLLALARAAACMILKAASYARRRFIPAEALSILGPLVGLVALVWTVPRFGVKAAAWVGVGRYCVTLC